MTTVIAGTKPKYTISGNGVIAIFFILTLLAKSNSRCLNLYVPALSVMERRFAAVLNAADL